MINEFQQRVERWVQGDAVRREEVGRLSREEMADAFGSDLSFGTGGMRALMGAGTNRMNGETVRRATQGLCNYLRGGRLFVGYDVRHNSRNFAEEVARVCAGNGMEVLVTRGVCPTPLASFGCRYYGCVGAVMITASHNPPEYNGYKVYGSDGGQVVPPQDAGILEEIRRVCEGGEVRVAELTSPLIRWVGEEVDAAYLEELQALRCEGADKSVHILYTNLHGTGLRLVPRALSRWGFERVDLVEAQRVLDGNFSTVSSPNPEDERALAMGMRQLVESGADLLLANDPDADRLGAAVRVGNLAVRLNGNEIGALCLFDLIERRALPARGAVIKTIVTSELIRKMAERAGLMCVDVLTGFKYIAERMREWEGGKTQFVFGVEESHGYLFGSFVRDKDGVLAACLLAEAAEGAKRVGRTLWDQLREIYRVYGVHRQKLSTIPCAPLAQQKLMRSLREAPQEEWGGVRIVRSDDYLARVSLDRLSGKSRALELAQSDVLHFWLEDGSTLVIRPSGTEPKLKVYAEVSEAKGLSVEEGIVRCDEQLEKMIAALATKT